ncbi:PapB/FocB family fimbrial expression transcriptional regulator [Citrobacter meridianamericanus]|uniref:PapB/FocB family fimbrial expression transcriptional regulator n=1 Tax=Citrobacter meridianamericanus TaxID=2894201 RepID=UPI00351D7C2E
MVYTSLNIKVNTLAPGQVSNEQFCLLIDISSVRSDKVIHALQEYFVNGEKRNIICEKYHVNPGYLSIKIREVQALSRRILDIYPYFLGQMPHVS